MRASCRCEMRRGLGVDRHAVRAGAREVVEVVLRLDDHQVHVERKLGELAHRLDDLRAEGEVGNEAAVHHVDVNPVGAACLEPRDLVGEMREVGAQDRRRDAAGHGAASVAAATRSCTVDAGRRGLVPGRDPDRHRALGRSDASTCPRCAGATRNPTCMSSCAADEYDCPMTSGTASCAGPLLTMNDTADGSGVLCPAGGRDDEHLPARRRALALA